MRLSIVENYHFLLGRWLPQMTAWKLVLVSVLSTWIQLPQFSGSVNRNWNFRCIIYTSVSGLPVAVTSGSSTHFRCIFPTTSVSVSVKTGSSSTGTSVYFPTTSVFRLWWQLQKQALLLILQEYFQQLSSGSFCSVTTGSSTGLQVCFQQHQFSSSYNVDYWNTIV